MKELKLEAATWELYEREIREAILNEDSAPLEREAVNVRLQETYAKLEPLLEAYRTLAYQEGYRRAVDKYSSPNNDVKVEEEMKAERRRLDEVRAEQRARVAELEEELKDHIQRVHMLRAIREDLPPAVPKYLPEPP